MAKILLAEDETGMRHFLTAALERAGHIVTACPDGLSALAELEGSKGPFDLLLSDIVMPGIDGIELSQRAMLIHPTLKVLFITGFAAIEKHQADAPVLPKPFHLGQLVKQIDEILAS